MKEWDLILHICDLTQVKLLTWVLDPFLSCDLDQLFLFTLSNLTDFPILMTAPYD